MTSDSCGYIYYTHCKGNENTSASAKRAKCRWCAFSSAYTFQYIKGTCENDGNDRYKMKPVAFSTTKIVDYVQLLYIFQMFYLL